MLTQLLAARDRPGSLRCRTRPHLGRRNRDRAEGLDALHEPTTPLLALVRNTDLLRDVVTHVGLTPSEVIWAEHTDYADTFTMATRVMRTPGLHHALVDASIAHAFEISYIGQAEALRAEKEQRRDQWLTHFRALDSPAGTVR